MEVNFTALKQKDVININDGRNMGKVCDLSFTIPENNVLGFTVTGSKGFRFSKQEVFIPINQGGKKWPGPLDFKFGGKKPPPPQKTPKAPKPAPTRVSAR